MNAREIMQALLDGKMVRSPLGISYKLSDDKLMLKCDDGEWNASCGSFNDSAMKIVENVYDLTFKEAMQEAIDGKKITSEKSIDVYFFNEYGELVVSGRFVEGVINYPIDHEEINAKWRVVE